MADFTSKLAGRADVALAADERLLVASRAMGAAGVRAITLGPNGSRAATAGEQLPDSDGSGVDAARFPFATSMIVALTNRRIVVWDRSAWTGRPRRLLGEVPLESIADMQERASGTAHELGITFRDGSALMLDLVRGDVPDGVVQAWRTAR